MTLPATEKMLTKVRKFVADPILLVSAEEAEGVTGVPDTWVAMLRQQEEGLKSWVGPWQPYQALLPGVYDFLQHKVRGVCVLRDGQKPPSLIYVYSRGENDYFYQGRLASGGTLPEGTQALWQQLPPKLQNFYSQLHDGWTQLSSNALGPLPIEEIESLADQDWDIEAGDENELPFQMDQVITVFSNGAGDYIGLDLSQKSAVEQHALVWWHEEPLQPDLDQDFWALMDAWISGQMEDVDLAA